MGEEFRSIRTEVRVIPPDEAGGAHRFWARVLNYGVLDDYNTEWAPGVFAESLGDRMPRLAYGHAGGFDIRNLVGVGIDAREAPAGTLGPDDPGGLDVCFEMSDFDAVPTSRQFWSQLGDPVRSVPSVIDQFSVGFGRQEDEPSAKFSDVPGARRITKGWLQEVSGVMTGAVPGTKLLAMSRSAGQEVEVQFVNNVLGRQALGEITLEDALHEIRTAARPERRDPIDLSGDDEDEEDGEVDIDVIDLIALGQAISLLQDGLDESESIPDLVQAVVDAFGEIMADLAEAADGTPDADDAGQGGVTPDMMAALTERARWSKKFINSLPDAAFAHVADGGVKDDSGKTVPRSLRMFPHHTETGAIDTSHARNAAARIPQADLSQEAKDKAAGHVQHHMDDPKWSHAFTRSADGTATRDEAAEAVAVAAALGARAWLAERR